MVEKLFNWISIIFALIGGLASNLFGAWDKLFGTFITIMMIDYVTGFIKGAYNKNLSSEIGWKGVLKKLATLCVVVIANAIQSLLGDNMAIRDIVMMFYISNEALSVLENVAAVSNVIPPELKDILLQLRSRKEDNNGSDNSI